MPNVAFVKTTPHSLITINACVFAQVHEVQSIASDSRRRPLGSSDFDTFVRETARFHSEGCNDEDPFAGLSGLDQENKKMMKLQLKTSNIYLATYLC